LGDVVDANRQDAYNQWIEVKLGVSLPGKLQYYKYRDRPHMGQLTGISANGWAEPADLAVHSIFDWHAHETAHVFSSQVGRPSDFFNEGLAVALSVDPLAGDYLPSYSGSETIHDWCRRSEDKLQAIADMVTTANFRDIDELVAYQQAGSFVDFLITENGILPLLDLFGVGRREDSLGIIEINFLASFGFSLEEAETRWREFLGP
jgi:hypothetical protein